MIYKNIPTPDQVQHVIDTLEKAMAIAENSAPVNMFIGAVNYDHPCGTPHCHAGWFMIGILNEFPYWRKAAFLSGEIKSSYENGAREMANCLGFSIGRTALEWWAHTNPHIWGNKFGRDMFHSGAAFGFNNEHGSNEHGSLQKIIDHWKGVKERLMDHLQNHP